MTNAQRYTLIALKALALAMTAVSLAVLLAGIMTQGAVIILLIVGLFALAAASLVESLERA